VIDVIFVIGVWTKVVVQNWFGDNSVINGYNLWADYSLSTIRCTHHRGDKENLNFELKPASFAKLEPLCVA